ncbi:MAG: alpha/beta hydrolase [Spirochaetia bacterium]|nr:alpha/beta hydrolase [Spirochaetia bacterium]
MAGKARNPFKYITGKTRVKEISIAWGHFQGRGIPAIMIHGMSANHLCFLPIARALNSSGMDILAYDLRGRGQSDKPKGAYSSAIHAGDLRGLLRNPKIAKRFKKPLLIAHSLGAYAALEFLRLNPNDARGLVLLDGGARLTTAEQFRIYIMLRLSFIRLGRKFKDSEAYLKLIKNSPLIKQWTPDLETMIMYDMETTPEGVGLNIPLHVIESELNSIGGSLNVARSIKSLYRNPTGGFAPVFNQIKIPVLVVRATQRNLFPGDSILTERGAREMVGEFPNAILKEVSANHYTILTQEQPELNQLILDFANSLPGKR